ncbi:MAG: hypothetical protein HZB38_03525 [Planctomycetes bacterium]|nr:hypothetical protein [Planctomycetota bacterium]
MAVRPISRGGDGNRNALVALVIIAVAAIGAFIWQLTNNKDLQNKLDTAEKRARKFGTAPEFYSVEAANRGSTEADTMADHLKKLALLVSGHDDILQPAIEAESRRMLKQVAAEQGGVVNPEHTLFTALTSLSSAYGKLTQAKAALQAERDELANENQQLAAGNMAARKEFEEKIAEIRDDLSRIEREKDEAIATKDKQFTELQTASESQTEEMNRQRVERQTQDRNTEIEIARSKKLINDLQAKIDELKPSAFDANAILTRADGRIMRAIPGSDVVYIDLGSHDKLRAGMGFEVFSPTGERLDSEYRGKASVEVVTVLDTTAECRITRSTALKPIVEGDIVVNVAFERNRKTKFVVQGDFDLDYNDEIDWDGVERVSGLVREWGGQVVPEVDESVDFVVLGTGPQLPQVLSGKPTSAVVEDLTNTRAKDRAAWLAVIEAARARNIPILTQTQFLYLTGERGGAFAQR